MGGETIWLMVCLQCLFSGHQAESDALKAMYKRTRLQVGNPHQNIKSPEKSFDTL
jgi:hypothetical protein